MSRLIKIFLSITIFLIFLNFDVLAFSSTNEIVEKLEKKEIFKLEPTQKLANKDQEKTALKKVLPQQLKKSFEELQNEEVVPDLIISIDSEKVQSQEVDRLIKKLELLKNNGKKINYYSTDKLRGIYLYLYNSKEYFDEFKEKLTSNNIKVSLNQKLVKQYNPNDPYYSSQWNLNNINWSSAMDIGGGSNEVIIGIIDNGIDVDDPELATNIWQNPNEIYNNSNDDDGNGYIDDKYGCNFYMRVIEGYTYIPCLKDYIKEDLIFDTKHGTYISQVAAAVTNNSTGISGVCPNCKVASLKITDSFGSGNLSLLPFVFDYAVDKGFKVLNFSMGSSCPFGPEEDILASDIDLLINTYGISFVQAAGNAGSRSQSECLADCPGNNYCYSSARNQAYYYIDGKSVANKINVASIDSSNQRSYFSNYDGSFPVLTIAAPGSLIPVYENSSLLYINGTSFSAPMVSGALGLVLTKYDKNPTKLYTSLVNAYDSISTDYNISGRKLNLYKLYQRFPDVQPDHTFYSYIENLASNSVISGYPDGLFRPQDYVTRGAMAKFIKNGYNFSTNTSCGNFPDVPPSNTFYNEITTLKCYGVIQGYPDGYFRPDENVSRGAAMKFVINGLRKIKNDDDYLRYYGSDQRFPDLPPSHTFYEYIMAAWNNSIVNGFPDGYFRPENTTTRGEMSKMVSNGRTKL